MYIRLDQCPVCGSEEQTNVLVCEDHLYSKESFAISECKVCNLRFTNPRPVEENLGKYYESQDYISHKNKSNNLVNYIYRIARFFTLRSKLKIVKKYSKNGNLLDVGCATGHFLNFCKQNGFTVTGVEPNEGARNIAIEQNGNVIYKDVLEIDTKKTFDIITMWHVLEHVPNLQEVFQQLKKLLKKDGTLIIAVPNYNSLDAKIYKEHWAAYDVPRHLYHFTKENIKILANLYNMRVKEIIPMKLDSYYVSMLSEKNKNGKVNYLSAIKNGFKSNNYAKQNENNYSSVIYIIKK